ncbi:28 kDa ribonucleoprotein [Apiospora hydei]|uniref:28 kDa ribonucleoprotein n=1 Tax=Apiospora hydei TaxID=1337664 RepID=A0ABR1X0K1_9PEZI
MGKSTKQATGKAAKADAIISVKSAGVSKSKKGAKEAAPKASAKDLKKKKKVESESESESSDSEEEEDSDDSEEDSDDSDDSESESEKEVKKPAAKAKKAAAAPATNGKAKKAAKEDSSDSSDSSDDEMAHSDAEGGAKTAAASKKAEKETSDDSDDDDEDSDDDDDDDDSEASDSKEKEEKAAEPSKKRKADDESAAPAKKAKAESSGEEEITTLFVGNLGWGIDDDLLYKAFEECDELNSARVVTDKHMQRSRGFGYVDFKTAEACKAAHEKMQGFELEGRAMNLDFSKPRSDDAATPNARANDRAQKHGDTVSPESDTLFVGNLPFDADEDMVTAFFSESAEVKSLRLPTDPESGNRKGFGYVTFNSVDDAKSAFNSLNGGYIGEGRGSRAVRLDYASQRPPREGGGFGGGRGGGRGGFGGRGGGRGGGGFGGRGGGDRGGRGGFGGRGGGRGGGGFGGGRGGGGFQGKKITF